MANAQILLLVAGAVPADTIRTAVEAAARANGFTPSAWTYAQGSDTALRDTSTPSGRVGTFSTGPFLGKSFSTATPFLPPASATAPTTAQVPWTAFRMNLLNGPDRTPGGDETSTALIAIASALRSGIPNVIGEASRGASNTISWDRGVPAAITLPEAGSSSGSGGLLIGLALVAGVAVMAGRGTSRQRSAMAGLRGADPDDKHLKTFHYHAERAVLGIDVAGNCREAERHQALAFAAMQKISDPGLRKQIHNNDYASIGRLIKSVCR